jgi:hypothetical protein
LFCDCWSRATPSAGRRFRSPPKDEDGRGVEGSFDHAGWIILRTGMNDRLGAYRAVLSQIDKSKLLERIAEAKKSVVLRARELFQAAGDNGEETEALDDVMYTLHALRSNYQNLGVS